MKQISTLALGSIALALSAPAQAQDSSPPTAEAASETAEAAVDPARLEAAGKTVDYLFPLGTYERMMKGTLDQMMDSMLAGLGGLSMGDLAGAGGVAKEDIPEGEGEKTLAEISKEMDPHFEERMKISTKVMMDEMVDLMTQMEPQIRTTLTSIYARKYTVSQLQEMNSFFATDTGSAFARDYMMVFVDPEMMQSMMGMVPEMMQAMPEIMKKVEEATSHLPPVKTQADIFDETLEGSEDEVAVDAVSEDDRSWEDPDSWSEQDRELVNKLSNESDEAFERYYAALEAAQNNARERMNEKK